MDMQITPDEFSTPRNPPFVVAEPQTQTAPLVLNSPHSGRIYPEPFLELSSLGHRAIRKSEDFLVDELIADGKALGLPMLHANFPRAYLDVNREPYEFDPQLFDGPLPDWVNTHSVRVNGGLGTIARIVAEGEPIYARRLPVSVGLSRIENFYKPYHAALRMLLAQTHVRFGYAVLLDFHSMPSNFGARGGGPRADFVIGDRYNTSCAPELTRLLRSQLENLGYQVEINQPYAGGFITEHYGRPAHGLHAVQIEINRGLYMNEQKYCKTLKFDLLRQDMVELLKALAENTGSWLAGSYPLAAE